ncbi:MAG TPA: hypothetical protein VK764_08210 [Terracidiphilus sp.]|jgi:hypothetical protein|nr:hypothetical protein [Terracidiphilus sp.]
MRSKTKLIVALTGMAIVLICEFVAIFERGFATSPAFLLGFAAISTLGFWAMSLHRLGR